MADQWTSSSLSSADLTQYVQISRQRWPSHTLNCSASGRSAPDCRFRGVGVEGFAPTLTRSSSHEHRSRHVPIPEIRRPVSNSNWWTREWAVWVRDVMQGVHFTTSVAQPVYDIRNETVCRCSCLLSSQCRSTSCTVFVFCRFCAHKFLRTPTMLQRCSSSCRKGVQSVYNHAEGREYSPENVMHINENVVSVSESFRCNRPNTKNKTYCAVDVMF